MEVLPAAKDELYAWLGAISGMRELVDEVQLQNLSASTWTIVNKEWENTIPVKEIDILTDKLGVYSPLFASMGDVAAYHPDQLTALLLTGGFASLCYTGKNFFDANHEPLKGGIKFTNKHTYKLSANSYNDALTNLKSRLNAKGRPMGLGRKLILVVSPKNETLGKQILQSDFIMQTAANAGTIAAAACGQQPLQGHRRAPGLDRARRQSGDVVHPRGGLRHAAHPLPAAHRPAARCGQPAQRTPTSSSITVTSTRPTASTMPAMACPSLPKAPTAPPTRSKSEH